MEEQDELPKGVIPLHVWEVVQFSWGTAVRHQRTMKWTNAFLLPDGREINLEGIDVELHDNGIEFI
jgi:hypothetical protein